MSLKERSVMTRWNCDHKHTAAICLNHCQPFFWKVLLGQTEGHLNHPHTGLKGHLQVHYKYSDLTKRWLKCVEMSWHWLIYKLSISKSLSSSSSSSSSSTLGASATRGLVSWAILASCSFRLSFLAWMSNCKVNYTLFPFFCPNA